MICTPAQHGYAHFNCVPNHADQELDGNSAFEATLRSWCSIAYSNDRSVETSKSSLKRGRYFESPEIITEGKVIYGGEKRGRTRNRRNRRNLCN